MRLGHEMGTHSGYQATCFHETVFNSLVTHKQTHSCVLRNMHSNALSRLLMHKQAFRRAQKGPQTQTNKFPSNTKPKRGLKHQDSPPE